MARFSGRTGRRVPRPGPPRPLQSHRRAVRVLSPSPSAHPRVAWTFMRFLDAFPWGYLGVGVVGNVLFFVGSLLFVVGAAQVVSGSLFVAGSALMLAGALGNLSRYDWQNRQQQQESGESSSVESAG